MKKRNTLGQYFLYLLLVWLFGGCSDAEPGDPSATRSHVPIAVYQVSVQSVLLSERPARKSRRLEALTSYSLVYALDDPVLEKGQDFDAHWLKVETATGKIGYLPMLILKKLETFPDPIISEGDNDIRCDSNGCTSAVEIGLLQSFPEVFSRNGRWLRIQVEKDNVTLEDSSDLDHPSAVVYRASAYYQKQNAVLIEKRKYEGGEFLLLDLRTGVQIPLWNKPLWSPDGNLLLICSAAVAYDTSGIQIIDVIGLPPEALFQVTEPWFPGNCQWESDDRISFLQQIHTPLGWVRQKRFIYPHEGTWVIMR